MVYGARAADPDETMSLRILEGMMAVAASRT